MPARRTFLFALGATCLPAVAARAQSPGELLVAAIQDGGKTMYLRSKTSDAARVADRLGRALRALRVPLNEILASPVPGARETADIAFGADLVRVTRDLVAREDTRRLIGTPAGPGMNRDLDGERAALEQAAGRAFDDRLLPEGAMAVFLPGGGLELLGTITAEQVIASAERRGALPR
ncbi:MAG: hypothetical protein HY824_01635 [Acidobacteria bacterium]|nr:hypothetical protein [Acidobacteriota bacterium]